MALNEQVRGRLFNFKFDTAVYYLDGTEEEWERTTVQALADMFGNVGWGLDGNMGQLVYACIRSLGVDTEEVVG